MPTNDNYHRSWNKEGVFKLLNHAIERVNHEQFIIVESWRKQRARLQEQNPTAKIKYSYKTKQFTILFGPPSDSKNFEILKIGAAPPLNHLE